jgi:hypothetical protein
MATARNLVSLFSVFFFSGTATVVIAVGVGTANLALGKHATQSSTFLYQIGCNMKVLLIGVGAEVCFIRNTNLVVA